VAKAIIEGHGGTIECQSPPGAGATFAIRLPRCKAPGDRETSSAAPIVAAPFDTLPTMPASPHVP
jgi:hypothetical protein